MSDQILTMLHGWGMSPGVFEPLSAHLESKYSLLTPGLPGYPRSQWLHEADFSRQLEHMAASLPRCRLLGWSLGGIYALELLRRYPEKFTALTLIAFNPCFVARADWPCAVAEAVFEEFNAGLAQDWQRTLRRFLALQMHGEADARDLSRALWRQIADAGQPSVTVLRYGLELLKNRDCRGHFAAIEAPVTLILGRRDRLVPIGLEKQIADLAPGIRVESVAGAGHAPFLSHSTQVAAFL